MKTILPALELPFGHVVEQPRNLCRELHTGPGSVIPYTSQDLEPSKSSHFRDCVAVSKG